MKVAVNGNGTSTSMLDIDKLIIHNMIMKVDVNVVKGVQKMMNVFSMNGNQNMTVVIFLINIMRI